MHAPVLVVEDDDVHARIVEASLAQARLCNPVVRVASGDEAVDWFSDAVATGSVLPALVLLDVELPGRSGLAVLEAVAGVGVDPESCPVIVMSASSDGGRIARARELGVRGYLVKPVAFDALADVIRRLGLRWVILGGSES